MDKPPYALNEGTFKRHHSAPPAPGMLANSPEPLTTHPLPPRPLFKRLFVPPCCASPCRSAGRQEREGEKKPNNNNNTSRVASTNTPLTPLPPGGQIATILQAQYEAKVVFHKFGIECMGVLSTGV